LDLEDGWVLVSTRRGKQFNSMIHGEIDPMIGGRRDDILVSVEDAGSLHLRDGDPLLVRSDVGTFRGRCKVAHIKPRNVQMYWPEANVLIRGGVVDPESGMSDYNAVVQLEPEAPA
ncbi:MAG: molybdopterin dinucleotide binding domain-containing protein, partial [Anaerolineae bacterium]